ncbi:hypothetical protein E2C01_003036 [Portunus trituberculatus]|uniref:Uncharacterized protein n=1 Tax=Portunus trituberculatus TaxID=210409 RepID=A0A5B7CL34_PORTR|nr:hypothetical protein [Portunus trituberculatus]
MTQALHASFLSTVIRQPRPGNSTLAQILIQVTRVARSWSRGRRELRTYVSSGPRGVGRHDSAATWPRVGDPRP